MPTDYDASAAYRDPMMSRGLRSELVNDGTRRPAVVDVDELESAESAELPGADSVRRRTVGARRTQADENALELLAQHRSRLGFQREERRW